MTNNTASLEYRRAATQQASVVGLVIALHDTLIGDLTRAANAMDKKNIQERCDQLAHGFKVIQQLESMLDMNNGGQTAIKVRGFYAHVRGEMLRAQFKLSPEILRVQIRIVLEVRDAWQQIDASSETAATLKDKQLGASYGTSEPFVENGTRLSFSCSY